MSDGKSSSSSGGVGFAGLLTIVFIALKLMGYITWSWWWVLSPLWIGFALFVVFLLVMGAIYIFASIMKKRQDSRRERPFKRYRM